MAQKEVKLPNGETVTVNVPDGATDQQILAFVKREYNAGNIGKKLTEQVEPEQPDVLEQPDTNLNLPQNNNIAPNADAAAVASPMASQTIGIGESLASMGSAVAGTAAGGWKGLLELAATGDIDRAVAEIEKTKKDIAYKPKTNIGKKRLNQIVDVLDSVGDATMFMPSMMYGAVNAIGGDDAKQALIKAEEFQQNPSKTLGNDVYELTGDPYAAAFAETAPTVASMIFGKKLPSTVANFANDRKVGKQEKQMQKFLENIDQNQIVSNQLTNTKTKELVPSNEIQQAIAVREGDYKKAAQDLIKKNIQVGSTGKIDNAVNQGFNADVISEFSNMTTGTRKKVKEMVVLGNKLINGTRTFKDKNRLLGVAGRSLQNRYTQLMKKRKELGRNLDQIVKTELDGQKIDVSETLNFFEKALEEKGLSIARNADGTIDKKQKRQRKIKFRSKPTII